MKYKRLTHQKYSENIDLTQAEAEAMLKELQENEVEE